MSRQLNNKQLYYNAQITIQRGRIDKKINHVRVHTYVDARHAYHYASAILQPTPPFVNILIILHDQ